MTVVEILTKEVNTCTEKLNESRSKFDSDLNPVQWIKWCAEKTVYYHWLQKRSIDLLKRINENTQLTQEQVIRRVLDRHINSMLDWEPTCSSDYFSLGVDVAQRSAAKEWKDILESLLEVAKEEDSKAVVTSIDLNPFLSDFQKEQLAIDNAE